MWTRMEISLSVRRRRVMIAKWERDIINNVWEHEINPADGNRRKILLMPCDTHIIILATGVLEHSFFPTSPAFLTPLETHAQYDRWTFNKLLSKSLDLITYIHAKRATYVVAKNWKEIFRISGANTFIVLSVNTNTISLPSFQIINFSLDFICSKNVVCS